MYNIHVLENKLLFVFGTSPLLEISSHLAIESLTVNSRL